MKSKKGFTLIELLAIIVILAVIAVITVPIILNIIENSRKGAVINSAYGYKDGLEKYYLSKTVDNSSFDGPTGAIDISDLPIDFKVNGEEPTEGWVELEKGKVVAYSLKFGEYVVTKYSSGEVTALKGTDLAENEEARASRLANERTDALNSADAYIAELEGLSSKIVSQTRLYSSLNELVTLDPEASSGWVEFDSSGNALKYSLKFGNYVVNYDSSLVSDQQTVTTGNTLSVVISGMTVNDVKYYDANWVKLNAVKYNPGRVATGNISAIAPGRCTSGDDCKIWYPYSEFTQGGVTYVNMIMDRNTTAGVEWVTLSDYSVGLTEKSGGGYNYGEGTGSKAVSAGVSYPDNTSFPAFGVDNDSRNARGPLTVLNRLHTDTDGWNLPFRTDSYTPASNSNGNYTIDYSGYKARLISAEEISFITGKNTASSPNSWGLNGSWFYLGSLSQSYNSSLQQKYSWLIDYTNSCTNYGCVTADSSTNGYWTSSPSGYYACNAWSINNNGFLDDNNVDKTIRGVRPVITVAVSDVF